VQDRRDHPVSGGLVELATVPDLSQQARALEPPQLGDHRQRVGERLGLADGPPVVVVETRGPGREDREQPARESALARTRQVEVPVAAAVPERQVGGRQPAAVALTPGLVEAQEDIVVPVEDPDGSLGAGLSRREARS
jgi:hypothetical protein